MYNGGERNAACAADREGKHMGKLAEQYTRLRTRVGGSREKSGFEYTFGMPEEEVNRIAPPSRMNRRVLAELEYAK